MRKTKKDSPNENNHLESARAVPTLKLFDDNKEVSIRFARCYAPDGHDFTKSFRVMRSAYWFKYNLLDSDAIKVYDHLHWLAEIGKGFIVPELAKQLNMCKAKLRELLDVLENLELIEIIKSDKPGAPNYYVIKTPYFEAKSLEDEKGQTTRKLIYEAGGAFPETTLEEQLPRLIENLKRNFAKIRRDDRKQYPTQKLIWHSIAKEIGQSAAATFSNIVHKVLSYLGKRSTAALATWEIFDNGVKHYCEEKNIQISAKLKNLSRELCLFYENYNSGEPRQAAPAAATAAPPTTQTKPVAVAAKPRQADEQQSEKASFRQKALATIKHICSSIENMRAYGIKASDTTNYVPKTTLTAKQGYQTHQRKRASFKRLLLGFVLK